MTDGVVLVTGASGCLGRAVVARAPERWRQRLWTPAHVELDLLDPEQWPRARFETVAGVIHLAALVHGPGRRADAATISRANSEATARLRALTPGRPFVLASTLSVHAPEIEGSIDERTPVAPGNDYGRSKAAAEREVIGQGGTALRFPICYGPGDRGNIARLAALLPKLGPIFPGRPEAELPVLGSANAADAIWRALERPEASGQVFVVADSPSTSMATLVNELCGVLGRPAPAWALPLACWQAVAALLRLTERIAPGLPLPRASAVSHLHGRLQVRLDRARQVLGYQAATPLAAGLAAQFAAAGGGTR